MIHRSDRPRPEVSCGSLVASIVQRCSPMSWHPLRVVVFCCKKALVGGGARLLLRPAASSRDLQLHPCMNLHAACCDPHNRSAPHTSSSRPVARVCSAMLMCMLCRARALVGQAVGGCHRQPPGLGSDLGGLPAWQHCQRRRQRSRAGPLGRRDPHAPRSQQSPGHGGCHAHPGADGLPGLLRPGAHAAGAWSAWRRHSAGRACRQARWRRSARSPCGSPPCWRPQRAW